MAMGARSYKSIEAFRPQMDRPERVSSNVRQHPRRCALYRRYVIPLARLVQGTKVSEPNCRSLRQAG
jgi:hypothetical protein